MWPEESIGAQGERRGTAWTGHQSLAGLADRDVHIQT